MGILNVTPDSFSDGGRYLDRHRALDRARQMVQEGADFIDVGGESTRPNASPVSESEELQRVLPIIESLCSELAVPISIDTRKVKVAEAALESGAVIVNDIEANRCDPAMWRLVAEKQVGYIAVHMQGTPETMQQKPAYTDVVREIDEFFKDRLQRIANEGVREDQIVLDVGIGFGKTLSHNLSLIAGLKQFTKRQRPLLLGVSRKSFIAKLLGAEVQDRMPAGLACASLAIEAGVSILRTHDVAATVQAARMTEAILAHRNRA